MPIKFDAWSWIGMMPGSSQPQLPTGQPAGQIKKLQQKGYISVRTLFNNICTIHEMYVAICTQNISYTNLAYTCLYIVCTCLFDSKRVCKCINMYMHVWTMYLHVYSPECTYHVRTMYIHVHNCTYHVHTCIYISWYVRASWCLGMVRTVTVALSEDHTYMVQTCMYMFIPGG